MNNRDKPSSKSNQSSFQNNNGVYEIKIKGHLDDHWKPWFEGMVFKHLTSGDRGQECTLITGPVVDQPALHGLLAKIRDLNLTLIYAKRVCPENSDSIKDEIP